MVSPVTNVKELKKWNTENNYGNCMVWFFRAVMHLQDTEGMANSADPNQTAPQGAV